MLESNKFLFVNSLMMQNQQKPSYTDFMLILFVSMMIMLSMSSLLFVNIVVSCCHSLGFHMSLMLIYTCCHILHSIFLATTMDSITLEVSNGAYVHVNMSDQYAMIKSVKVARSKVTTTLCVELFHRFLDVEIMLALGIVYL